MKKILFYSLVAMAALSAASCNKNSNTAEPNVIAGRTARVSITLHGSTLAETKALPVAADEALVNTVDAFVFNSTGDLDAYGHYVAADFTTTEGVTTLNDDKKLDCTTGAGKIVYVVINGNNSNLETGEVAFANIATEAQLKARIFKLEDNKIALGDPATDQLKNFQMIGKTADQTFNAGDNSVNVQVVRDVARVVIKKITKNFTSAGLAGDLTIKNIYMSNVVGQYGFGNIVDNDYNFNASSIAAAQPAAKWHNKYVPAVADPAAPASVGVESGYNLWLNRALLADVAIAEDASKTSEIESTFYVMPNDVAWGYDHDSDDQTDDIAGPFGGDSWSARHTKLVIETQYAGTTYYYVIPIAENGNGASYVQLGSADDDGTLYRGIKANYSYEIEELELTRLGSTNPDEPTLVATVNFNITVKPWDVVLLGADGKYTI